MTDQIKVGDTLWRFDYNRRVYAPDPAGRPGRGAIIYREHFCPYPIVGETPRSWLLDTPGRHTKVSKAELRESGGGFGHYQWHSAESMEADIWRYNNVGRITDGLRHATVAQLKAIDAILKGEVSA